MSYEGAKTVIALIDNAREKLLGWTPPWMTDSWEELRIMIDRDLRSAQLSIALASGTAPLSTPAPAAEDKRVTSETLSRWHGMISQDSNYRESILLDEVYDAFLDAVAREARAP
jgi:hypothetical protein